MSETLYAADLLKAVQVDLPELSSTIASHVEALGGPARHDSSNTTIFGMSFSEGLLGRLSENPPNTDAILAYANFLERMLASDDSSVQNEAETGVIEQVIGWTPRGQRARARSALGPRAQAVFDDLIARGGFRK